MVGRTQIEVSEQVKARLDALKDRDGHKSLDSVIRHLLWETGEMQAPELERGVRKLIKKASEMEAPKA